MDKVAVFVTLKATEGKGGELVAAFKDLYDGPLDAEPGTALHIIHQGKDDPDTVYFYEMYDDQAALDTHSTGEALRAVFPKLAGLVAGRGEMVHLIPQNAKGVKV